MLLLGLPALVLGVAAFVSILGLASVSTYAAFATQIEPPEEIEAALPRGGARIYDRNGTLLYEFVDPERGMRRPVPLEQVSPWLIEATLATEDPTFFENPGVNIRGLARAGWENLGTLSESGTLGGSGGSSVTQQLARNLYFDPAERAERTIERKLREMVIALELTRRVDKNQLLEWYLNSISYGGAYVGIEAASQAYFAKPAADLTLPEAALLAGIPQSPARYDPRTNPDAALERQRQVLGLMASRGAITPEAAAAAAAEQVVIHSAHAPIRAPHFVLGPVVEELKARFDERALFDAGLEVRTSLDLGLQDEAQAILERSIAAQEARTGGHNGAVYALSPETGEVLVYLGSRDYFNTGIEGHVDNIVALNSPGSTLKPFTFMHAFMKGWGTGTGIIDQPLKIVDPSNDDREVEIRDPISTYQGVITADKALGNSLNVTAVKAIMYAGVPETVELLHRIGFDSVGPASNYGPALTLGGVDVSLEDLVNAYGVLASGGEQRGQLAPGSLTSSDPRPEPVVLLEVRDSYGGLLYKHEQTATRRVVPESAAYLVTSILADGNNQCITFGVCGALSIPGLPAAVKTGTSEPFDQIQTKHQAGETWAVGFTPHLVAGIWYGNADNTPMPDVLSTQVGWPALRDLLQFTTNRLQLPREGFTRPPTVVERQVCWPSGRLPSKNCPQSRRYASLFSAEAIVKPPEEMRALEDTWWQPSFGGTVRLVTPREDIARWSIEAQGWVFERRGGGASDFGLASILDPLGNPAQATPSASAQTTPGTPSASLTSPGGGRVSGAVLVRGTVAGEGEVRGTVEVIPAGSEAVAIGQVSGPVSGGQLAVWNTTSFPDGLYTLRLRVTDASGRSSQSSIIVTVAN
jgi:membrane peptidoglycan carboxypeptidase